MVLDAGAVRLGGHPYLVFMAELRLRMARDAGALEYFCGGARSAAGPLGGPAAEEERDHLGPLQQGGQLDEFQAKRC